MGRGKHCSPEKRELIKKLISSGKTYKEVQNIIGCGASMVRNALKYSPKAETRGRPRVISDKLAIRVARYSKQHPFSSCKQIKDELNLNASIQTISRRLKDNNLTAHSPRKIPFHTKKHIAARIQFAKRHIDWSPEKWRNILWSDESKIVLYGGKGSRQYVRRPPNTEFNSKYCIKTIKHGGTSIMVWACFSYYGVGPIHWIRDIMDGPGYVKIMQDIMLPYASDEMPLIWVFQQDNDPKHTSKVAKKWFADNGTRVLEWPAQSPDLNPIENLWADVKKVVAQKSPTNISELWETIRAAWSSIPPERCQKLVDSMPRRCAAVLHNKGGATKY